MKNLRKKYSNDVFEQNILVAINHILMSKTIKQNPEEHILFLTKLFYDR